MEVTSVPAKEERGRPDWIPNFAFAFDDSIFSDRILRIEIFPDSPAGDASGEPTLADSAGNRKRSHDPDPGEDNVAPAVIRVRNIHISSPILASRSQFFYKLFSNGMKESQQREVTLRIHASEEAVFLDLLNFMYRGTLSMSSPASLLDMLVAADKFEVASCVTECSSLLRELPMTIESALLYLDLPTSVSMGEAVQPLIDVAKQFLATHYRDIVKFPEEIFNLPLAGLEAVLSSDNLLVASEDYVFELVLEWARVNYPRSEDRQKILTSRLFRFIRFPFMTREMLIKVLTCNDFDHEFAAKVLGALLFKGEPPHEHQILAEADANISHRHFVERAYKCRPIKVVEFERPHQQCIVYLDLKREELEHLSPSEVLYSETFRLGGQRFFLSAYRKMNQQSSLHCFGLYLTMKENGSASLSLDHEVAARQKPSGDFVSKRLRNYTFTTGSRSRGCRDLFGIPWETFISEDNTYFIDGILHLRAVLTIKK